MGQPFVGLEHGTALRALRALAASRDARAPKVYVSVLEAMERSVNKGRSIRLPVRNGEAEFLSALGVRCGLLECVRPARWVAVYRHPEAELVKEVGGDFVCTEVTVCSPDRPPKRKVFTGAGGRRKYERVSLNRITVSKEENTVAPTKRTRNRKNAKPAEVEPDELEELEALEELVDEDEPEDEPKPKRRTRKKAKPAPEPEPEDDDEEDEEPEEDEDDDDDEEEAPAPKRRTRRTTKPADKPATKKRTPSKNKGGGLPSTRELPKGKVGVDVVAELAGTDERAVRVWLRTHSEEHGFEREGGRWAFTQKQAQQVAKKMKGGRKG